MAGLMGQAQLGSRGSGLFGGQVATRQPTTATRVPSVCPPCITAGLIGPGKKWEHYETNKNGKVVRVKMHVKTGDTVIVVAGNEKGKVGEITKVNRKTGQVFLEGTNMKTRYQKPKGEGESGLMEQKESPIHHSNVMHYSKEQKVRSRVGMKFTEDGRKVRYLKKTGEVLD